MSHESQRNLAAVRAREVACQFVILRSRVQCTQRGHFPPPFSAPELRDSLQRTAGAIRMFREAFGAEVRSSIVRPAAVTVSGRSAPTAHELVELLCDRVSSAVDDALGFMTVRWPLPRERGWSDYKNVLSELWEELQGVDFGKLHAELECESNTIRRTEGAGDFDSRLVEPVAQNEISATEITKDWEVPGSTLQSWGLKPIRRDDNGTRIYSREEAEERRRPWEKRRRRR